jgi:two-component system, chemotaxis family, sensor kinase CheA
MPQYEDLWGRIDALASRVVLQSEAEGHAEALGSVAELRRIGADAGQAGYPETARTADELAEQLAGEPRGVPQATEQLLRDGILRLQEAIARESRAPASPRPPSDQEAAVVEVALGQDPELLNDFVVEAREHLAGVEAQLLVLESEPLNSEALRSIFRGFHTIKGLAGFLDLSAVREVSHEVETVLDLARNGTLTVTPPLIDVILKAADTLSVLVQCVDAGLHGRAGCEQPDYTQLLQQLKSCVRASPEPAAVDTAPQSPVPAGTAEAAPSRTAGPAAGGSDRFAVRVDTGKLDYLMDMVGEMVITQSQIHHDAGLQTAASPKLARNLSQLSRITTEVQRTAMALRMVPIGQLFGRTARVVRDLSRKAGKQVQFESTGDDISVDKTIVEEMSDPLMHMVRNAIDHGIETTDERAATGKSEMARVSLSASHQGPQIVITVADDGRGLNARKILDKAKSRGIVSPDAEPSQQEILNLIFQPGFSTADRVTDVSGRGVGMDVVFRQVQKLRGRVEIQTELGRGSTFLIRLPLLLAIIDGLIIAVGAERYVLPIFAVREMFRPARENIFSVQGQAEMALVRGRLLPIVRLHRRFCVTPRSEDPCEALLIVCQCGEKLVCLMVDDLLGKQEVVIKSLGENLKEVSGISGGAILGDGRVGLILDVNELMEEKTSA